MAGCAANKQLHPLAQPVILVYGAASGYFQRLLLCMVMCQDIYFVCNIVFMQNLILFFYVKTATLSGLHAVQILYVKQVEYYENVGWAF